MQLHLEFANGAWRVQTKSVVTVDGQPVGSQGAALKNGARLGLGDVHMTFYEPEGFLRRLQQGPAARASTPTRPPGKTVR